VAKELVFGGTAGQGLTHLRNLDTVADPSVTRRDGRWWMVLGGTHGEGRVVQLYAAEPDPSDGGWRIVTEPDDPGLAVRLTDPPPPDTWDATGYHCPSYARGVDATGRVVERIYYAGSSAWDSLYGPYRIGFLEWNGHIWERHPEPVFAAEEPWERGTVLEPNVRQHDGRWLLRYTAGLADGVRSVTAAAESDDGISGWRRVGTPDEGFFDALVIEDDQGLDLITARQPLDSVFTPTDGLWHTRLGGAEQEARQILRTTDGTPWHNAGAWKPTAVADNDHLVVFFTAAQRGDNPYVPALGIGSLRVPRG
jgi:hypothetical protein